MTDKDSKQHREDQVKLFKDIERIKSRTIYDRTKRIDEHASNIKEVFEHNLFLWWLCFAHWSFVGNSVKTIYHEIKLYYNNGTLYEEESPITISDFLEDEIKYIEIEQRIPTKRLPNALKQYLKFLQNNKHRYELIDRLTWLTRTKEQYASLKIFAKRKIDEGAIDILLLDKEQTNLLWWCDRIILSELIHFKKEERNELKDKMNNQFNFTFYKNPPLYDGFPKEKRKYLKVLKSWLLAEIKQKIKAYALNPIPETYQIVMDYANSLVENSESKKVVQTDEKKDKPNEPGQFDYPKYIFKNYKAFLLFESLTKNCKNSSQISFFYRHMAEKENPPLIVVKDTPFREWFNEWTSNFKLDNHTGTYLNSKNKDRIAMYKTVKDLIFNNS